MSILQEIVRNRREQIKEQKSRTPLKELKGMADDAPPVRDFLQAIRRPPGQRIRFIAELKKASPSKGLIRGNFQPVEIAKIYEENGASAISILTEEQYFQGRLGYIADVKAEVELPLLRKDFIVDEYQIYESRAAGADAILLIDAILSLSQAEEFLHLANELGLSVLYEVHTLKELDRAILLNVPIIGINNRNLKDLSIDLNTTLQLIQDIPDDKVVVSESGINTKEDVRFIASHRVDAILIGTALMRAADIGEKIKELFS